MADDFILKTVARMNAGLENFFWDAFIALTVNGISGDYVEFGSWGGKTVHRSYETIRDIGVQRHLWAFDSFDALPEVTDPRDERWGAEGGAEGAPRGGGNGVEEFRATCDANGIPRDAYTAVEGYFEDTLPAIGASGEPADIALAYVDCNMYASTVTVFDFLAPRLKQGMIVGFDDYYCYGKNSVSGERAALHEFLEANPQWNFCRFKDIHWCGLAFVVEKASDLPSREGGRVAV